MSDMKTAETSPAELLWEKLGEVHAGMLGIEGSGQHMQPMAHHLDREGRRLWFFTKRDTDLYQALTAGATAHFTIVSKAQDFHACMAGTLVERHDRAKLDELWNPNVAAWFDGPDDPDLKMLALELRDAALWSSTSSSLAYLWETAKANVSDARPNVGVHNVVNFAA